MMSKFPGESVAEQPDDTPYDLFKHIAKQIPGAKAVYHAEDGSYVIETPEYTNRPGRIEFINTDFVPIFSERDQ